MKNGELFESTVSGRKKIFLKSHKSSEAIDISSILYFKADGNYTTIYSVDENVYEICKSLCEFESLLRIHDFLRVSYSCLVNLKRVESFNRKDRLVLVAGHKISISKRKCKDIFTVLIDFDIKEVENNDQLINILTV